MKHVPSGITSFRELREGGYIYVDKTQLIEELINSYKYVLLARPKGFGKSITLTTIEELFKGNRELFQGTALYKKHQFNRFPIIKFNFRGLGRSVEEVKESLLEQLLHIVGELDPTLRVKFRDKDKIRYYFRDLILQISKKENSKVVILVDNYDNSVLESLFNLEMARQIWNILRDFLLVVKDYGEYIQFAFFTGITTILKRTPFEVSPVEDITLHPYFSNICGFMYEEVLFYFDEFLQTVDMDMLKYWYYGYNFLGDFVFNPIDIISFIKNNYLFKPYWYMRISNEFFYRVLREQQFFLPEIEQMQAPEKIFNSFNLDYFMSESLAFHTGLITIESMKDTSFGTIFSFRPPNKMVQINLNDDLIRFITNKSSFFHFKKELYISFKAGDINKFRKTIRAIFETLDPDHFVRYRFDKWRGIHITLVYAYLMSLGGEMEIFESTTETITFSYQLEGKVYLIRISPQDSLKELLRTKYYDTIRARRVVLLGLDFEKGEFNFSRIDWEVKEKYGVE
ncbi:MAG: AAA family ATPase [Campylobacterales bacterium]